MIPAKTSITQIDSMPGEEIEFSIGDPRWVMRTQADLYSNRELAVVREYSTNAFDANKERALRSKSDVVEAIEVTLPSMMFPYFKVRDFGDGMSREVLAEVYTKFGASTKRDSNEFNGMLGYGSKSAVAYTDTFTVTSIHAGIKTIAVITRKPDWSIVMKIVSQVHSDEPSGTEVQVPVHNWSEFTQKANDFYKFWLPGRVKVNGAQPVQNVGDKITDGLYYASDRSWNTSYVVMGNVPYRIENPSALFRNSNMRQINFVAYVENGDVEFTPSREDLKYTQHTKDGLHKVINDFEVKIVATAKAEIANAKTHPEAFEAWAKWCEVLGTSMFGNLEFKGDKFAENFKIKGQRYNPSAYRNSTRRISDYNVRSAAKAIFITECSVEASSTNRGKAREFARIKGWDTDMTHFIFTEESTVDCVWIDNARQVTWADLKAAIPRKAAQPRVASSRLAGSYDYYDMNTRHNGKLIPSTAKEIFYITASEQRPQHRNPVNVSHMMNVAGMKDAIVVRLGMNRLDKFKRENPDVKHFLTHVKTLYVKDGPSLLCDDAKAVSMIDSRERTWLNTLDCSLIDDPEFARVKALIKDETRLFQKYEDNLALAQALGEWYNVTRWNGRGSQKVATKGYALLDYMTPKNVSDVYIYLNAAYAARKDNK